MYELICKKLRLVKDSHRVILSNEGGMHILQLSNAALITEGRAPLTIRGGFNIPQSYPLDNVHLLPVYLNEPIELSTIGTTYMELEPTEKGILWLYKSTPLLSISSTGITINFGTTSKGRGVKALWL